MEVKVNKEIRNYTESIFFGLSLRQFVFSAISCGIAVLIYFIAIPALNLEIVSWLCILGAAPFAALGFIKYHGMYAEGFIWAWIKSEILIPKKLLFCPTNLYYEVMQDLYRPRHFAKIRSISGLFRLIGFAAPMLKNSPD